MQREADPARRGAEVARRERAHRAVSSAHPEAARAGGSRLTTLGSIAYKAQDGRQELLDDLARATEALAVALAAAGEAYEQLDERNADRLEDELFRPLQLAYGQARRTHAGFAERHGLPGRTFEPASPGPRIATGPRPDRARRRQRAGG